mmetsp:Transcript_20718/g.52899  ORF Transcript_20718/g.52899 Transcript_20718/m.52899 type:complete len:228 (-) Transcript_20718:691-1374(-)
MHIASAANAHLRSVPLTSDLINIFRLTSSRLQVLAPNPCDLQLELIQATVRLSHALLQLLLHQRCAQLLPRQRRQQRGQPPLQNFQRLDVNLLKGGACGRSRGEAAARRGRNSAVSRKGTAAPSARGGSLGGRGPRRTRGRCLRGTRARSPDWQHGHGRESLWADPPPLRLRLALRCSPRFGGRRGRPPRRRGDGGGRWRAFARQQQRDATGARPAADGPFSQAVAA